MKRGRVEPVKRDESRAGEKRREESRWKETRGEPVKRDERRAGEKRREESRWKETRGEPVKRDERRAGEKRRERWLVSLFNDISTIFGYKLVGGGGKGVCTFPQEGERNSVNLLSTMLPFSSWANMPWRHPPLSFHVRLVS